MLVGGGELHDTFDSLVRTERPLARGIQRFTGITQAMVDAAPPAARGAAGAGRPARGPRAGGPQRPLRPRACCARRSSAAGSTGREPPVICTVALARRFAPLVRKRGLASLADSLGIEVDEVHRALPDALTCARVFCALFPRLCANAASVADALELLSTRRARAQDRAGRAHPAERAARPVDAARRPRRLHLPRRARHARLRRQVGLAAQPRAGPLLRPRRLDREGGDRGLPPHQLRARRAGAREPADQVSGGRAATRSSSAPTATCYLRCRLDIAYPVLEVAAEPAPGQRRERRARWARERWRASWPTSSPRSSACATAGAR